MIDNNRLNVLLQALVQKRSLSGEEAAVIEVVTAEMHALGFDEIQVDGNGSAIGFKYGKEGGQTLLLDAHCDTVGIAPGVRWQHDPFAAEIHGRRIYGRGTSDMKGALAAMMIAAASADEFQGTVAVSASVMEEIMEGIALQSIVDIVQPDFVVIGESTGLNLNHGGRGRAEIHLEAIGKPAHSSTPHLGDNAVYKMLPAISAIKEMPLTQDPLLGDGIMALTDIISDPYPGYSVIPSRCRVTYDRRLLPGETPESVIGALKQLPALADINVLIAAGEHTTYTGTTLQGDKFFPAWKFEPSHPFVQAAHQGLHTIGQRPQLSAYQFCTNGAHTAGVAGIPTIGYGPSHESLAHIVDEYIDLDQLHAAALGYVGIINGVLGGSQ
ncbi:MAG: YgeY family selenium metabolism-linked hydrolase [Ardenticatenaceae bacterium]|nr:YgeY family selenium metabolism-linked hydrolase [Ardenticatenaceae bacterium]